MLNDPHKYAWQADAEVFTCTRTPRVKRFIVASVVCSVVWTTCSMTCLFCLLCCVSALLHDLPVLFALLCECLVTGLACVVCSVMWVPCYMICSCCLLCYVSALLHDLLVLFALLCESCSMTRLHALLTSVLHVFGSTRTPTSAAGPPATLSASCCTNRPSPLPSPNSPPPPLTPLPPLKPRCCCVAACWELWIMTKPARARPLARIALRRIRIVLSPKVHR